MVRLFLCLPIVGGGAPAALLAADPPSSVTLRTVEGERLEGRLVRLSLGEGVVLQADGGRRSIAPDAWMQLMPETGSAPPDPATKDRPVDEVTIRLSYGDRLVGRVVDEAKDALVIETSDLGRVLVPLDDLASITTARAGTAAYRGADDWFNRAPSPTDDAVLLTNGDVARGFITAIDAQGVTLDASTGPATLPYRLVVALRTVHPAPANLPAPYATVQLRDTSRVTARSIDWTDQGVEMKLRCGSTAHTSASRIERVECATPRWTWLTELRPVSVEQVPMLALGWDYKVNRNVRGGPLVVAGQTFDHGLGVHARSVLVYELGGQYKEFVTALGLDDDSGPYADVSVTVLVDGRPRLQTTGLKRGTLNPPVRIDVTRAGRIELVVDFGQNGDLQDRFNWIEPALVR